MTAPLVRARAWHAKPMDQRIREGEVAHLRSEQDRLEQRMDDDARLLKELETVAGRAQRSARRAQENAVMMQRIRMLQHTTAAAYQARDLAHLQSHAHAASMLPHRGMLGALPHALGHGIGAGMPLGMVGQEAMLDMQVQERLAALKEQDVRRHNNTALQSMRLQDSLAHQALPMSFGASHTHGALFGNHMHGMHGLGSGLDSMNHIGSPMMSPLFSSATFNELMDLDVPLNGPDALYERSLYEHLVHPSMHMPHMDPLGY